MCFSTTASFGAGAVLAIAGVASLKKVQTSSHMLFALFPLLFSVQQIIEGFVWITLTNSKWQHLQSTPIYAFVFFAQVIWTTWVPLAFYLMERNNKRKKILSIFVLVGSIISIIHFYDLLTYNVSASVKPYHIYYDLDFPFRENIIMQILYLLVIIVPALISSVEKSYVLGILLLISFLITHLYFKDYIISVWCFFSALVSLIVYIILKKIKEKNELTKIEPDLIKLKSTEVSFFRFNK